MLNGTANTQELVSIDKIRDNTIVMKNGSIRQIIMVGGMNFALKSEEEQNSIVSAYQDFLNSVDFPIQIVIHSRKINIENYLQKLEEFKNKEVSGILRNQTSEYQEFIRSFVRDNPIMRKVFLVVVPFAPINVPEIKSGSGLFPKKESKEKEEEKNQKAQEEEFQKSLAQLKQRVDQVVEGLHTVGLETVLLNNEQLTELFYSFYNPETIEQGSKK